MPFLGLLSFRSGDLNRMPLAEVLSVADLRDSTTSMDWHAVAASLAESQTNPIMVLDADGRIQLFNRAFEQLTGWDRSEVLGASWVEKFVSKERREASRARLNDAFRGALRRYDCEVVTRDLRGLRLSLELFLVGRRDGGAIVATVVASVALLANALSERDLDYEVSADAADFGKIRKLSLMGVEAVEVVGQKCYQAIYGRTAECESCPLRTHDAASWPRTYVRRTGESFQVMTALTTGSGGVQVSIRSMSESLLGNLIQAKIEYIARNAGLSKREQDVLTYLVLGRSLEEIATTLAIRVRTVKFHQANVLEKLGADSRVDLMRLIL